MIDRFFNLTLVILFGALELVPLGRAAEPEADPRELPRIPPVSADQALSTFEVKPGFHLELVAAEPLIESPIALSFDEDGRMYVVEMRDYSELRDQHLGRIRMLVDTDGDGRYDQSTVFAEGLPWPTSVFCYGGGVFVGATPDLFYLRDTNGDGVADTKELVFSGFASDYAPYQTNKLNVQALFNSLAWGLDNRIHGATSFNGGHVKSAKDPSKSAIDLRGRDFVFDPRTFSLSGENGGGQYGLCFDDTGRKFVCSNSDHLQMMMYDEGYAGRNPRFNLPPSRVSIAVDGPSAEVYRISPDEPWRVLRTKWRVGGLVPGPIEGGGRASGYFTAATGITIYRGNAWPQEYQGDVFVADCGSNLVHRKKLLPDGVALKGQRPAGEERTEFVRSRDNWFRPVQMANAPDGTLYIIDMYREVIEHPWSLPDSIKKHLDLNSGHDRGRIYRLAPDGFKSPPPLHLSKASTRELVETLAHPNGWHRDTASRLLYERQDRSAIPLLEAMLRAPGPALGRVHALGALEGLHALDTKHLLWSLADEDGRVRQRAIKLAESFLTQPAKRDDTAKRLALLATDPDLQVRYQLALTLSTVTSPDKVPALAEIVRRDFGDPWIGAAVLNALTEDAGVLFTRVADDSAVLASTTGREFIRQLVTLVCAQNHSADVDGVLAFLAREKDPSRAIPLANALISGLAGAGKPLAEADPMGRLKPILAAAADVAQEHAASESTRADALQLVSTTRPFTEAEPIFLSLLDTNEPPAVQSGAVNALGHYVDARVAIDLLERWPRFTPRSRDATLNVLLKRPDRIRLLFDAIDKGTVMKTDLASSQRQLLAKHSDPAIRERAKLVLGDSAVGQRDEVVQKFLPALSLSGDSARGRDIFSQRCISCHRLAGLGFALGPDLTTVKSAGREKILTNILDPNREVAPNYLSYLVETTDGETSVGLIAGETAGTLTLRQPYGKETVIARSSVVKIESQGLSAMPEGLEAGLAPQDLADLIEFILSAPEGATPAH